MGNGGSWVDGDDDPLAEDEAISRPRPGPASPALASGEQVWGASVPAAGAWAPTGRVPALHAWTPRPLSPAHRTLAVFVMAGLGFLAVKALGDVVRWWQFQVMFATWVADPSTIDEAASEAFDRWTIVLATADSVVYLVTGVLWLLWLRTMAAAVEPSALRRSPGWHVAHYLIPVANLILPGVAMGELAAAVRRGQWFGVQGAPGSSSPSSLLVKAWWASFVVMALSTSVARLLSRTETAEGIRVFSSFMVVESVLHLVAAVLAITLVWQFRGSEPRRAV